MFRYYLLFILIAMLLFFGVTCLLGEVEVWRAAIGIVIATATVFSLDALVAIAVRAIPAARLNPQHPFFRVRKGEQRVYVRMGIRRWKDKIPETGALLGIFSKKKVEAREDNAYLERFIAETCYAELMHVISIPIGFLAMALDPLFPYPFFLYCALPAACVNLVLQTLPILVQRYVRPYLLRAHAYNERKASR